MLGDLFGDEEEDGDFGLRMMSGTGANQANVQV